MGDAAPATPWSLGDLARHGVYFGATAVPKGSHDHTRLWRSRNTWRQGRSARSNAGSTTSAVRSNAGSTTRLSLGDSGDLLAHQLPNNLEPRLDQ